MCDIAKRVDIKNFVALNVFIKKGERVKFNELMVKLKLEKEQ